MKEIAYMVLLFSCSSKGSIHEGYWTANTTLNDNPLTLYHDRKYQTFLPEQGEKHSSSSQISALHRACLSLIHLQRVYQLDMEDLTKGIILDSVASPLEAEDFYIIGTVALSYDYHVEALKWLTMAETQLMTEQWNHLSEMVPNDDLEPSNLQQIKTNLEKANTHAAEAIHSKHLNDVLDVKPEVWNTYSELCRSSFTKDSMVQRDLYCSLQRSRYSYNVWNKEILYKDPEVSLFHNVISDHEIKILQRLFTIQLSESSTISEDGDSRQDRSRISKTGWVDDNDSFIMQLNQRISDVTGLLTGVHNSQSEAERFQLNFYEPGGVYEPHYDFMGDIDVPPYLQKSGDRIATFMFYLKDVLAGGATVFPRLGVRIPVIKGSAAFWYNLHHNGSMDRRTLHAGCPVLLGSKWVANKWIRERSQIFTRPCTTKQFV